MTFDEMAEPSAGGGHGGGEHGSAAPPGVVVAQDGYRLVPLATTLASGPKEPFRFRILGPDGRPVQRYDPLHERELHLIVVRRDLIGFQHLHPVRAADDAWAITLDLRKAGTWRAFADFLPSGGPGQLTLGVDLNVGGTFRVGAGPMAAEPPDPRFAVQFRRRRDTIQIVVKRDGIPIEPEPISVPEAISSCCETATSPTSTSTPRSMTEPPSASWQCCPQPAPTLSTSVTRWMASSTPPPLQ